jgi:hypothetical protein
MVMYAMRGEVVTCTAGHSVYNLPTDIPLFRPMAGTRQSDASHGNQINADQIAPRCRCGAPYARWIGTSIELHFSDGWRSLEHGKVNTTRPSNPAQRPVRYGGLDTQALRRRG